MAKKIGGLGKGLDALFADNSTDETQLGAINLKISQVEPNRDQPRKKFDDESMSELAESIKEHGLIQPILVKPLPSGQYKIIAGERRWRACRLAGLSEIPALIKEMTDKQVMEIALIENLQREDLNPIEEAQGYRSLMQEFEMTQEQVASRVGKSRPVVANSLRILSLPEKVIQYIENNKLSVGHGKVLLSLEDEQDIIDIAEIIVKNELSVRQCEKIIKTAKNSAREQSVGEQSAREQSVGEQSAREQSAQDKLQNKEKLNQNIFTQDSYFKEVEISLETELGRAVKVNVNEKNIGKLEIEFYNKEDLEELVKFFDKCHL